jgi:copper chaperone CopZ
MSNTFQAHSPIIHCEGCAQSIKRSLSKLPGVQSVEVEVERKNIVVEYDPDTTNETTIQERLTTAGFPAS